MNRMKMMEIFETFRPKNPTIKKYVDYYYLDIKENNIINEYQCFPHFNNTISLYKSHIRLENNEIVFDKSAPYFQIFTPIRNKVLNVKQVGKVHRIVVVFHPLGIQQFYKNIDFKNYITDFEFFNQKELDEIFLATEIENLVNQLDNFLEKRFEKFDNLILKQTLQFIFNHYEKFSIIDISSSIGVSRQHLNRLFQSHFGISVKKFQEIVLFRNTINKKLFEDSNESFTKIAHEFNFNDQSHFNKTYKSLTEKSPKAFFTDGTLLGKEDTFWHLQS